MKVKIQNNLREIVLNFDTEIGNEFIKCVKNCIDNPKKYPSLTYNDKKDTIIFTAIYLQNSLIVIPKDNENQTKKM